MIWPHFSLLKPSLYIDNDRNLEIWKKLIYIVAPVIMLSSIYCLPEYFEFYLCERTTASNRTKIELAPSNFRLNEYYIIIYKNVLNNLVTGLIPIFSLAWLNYKIYKCLNERKNKRINGDLGMFLFK